MEGGKGEGTYNSQSPSVRYSGGQLSVSNPLHASLHDWDCISLVYFRSNTMLKAAYS